MKKVEKYEEFFPFEKIKKKTKKSKNKKSIGDQLIDLLENKINSLTIENIPKRLNDEFSLRVCWKAETGDNFIRCEWEGFETTEEAVKDIIEKCK